MTVVVAPDFVGELADRDAPHHVAAASWVALTEEELVTTPLALAEIDRAAMAVGQEVAGRVREDFERRAYDVRWWADALTVTLGIAEANPGTDLVQASLVALAGRVRTDRIATFDARFRLLTTPSGQPFVMLPEDA